MSLCCRKTQILYEISGFGLGLYLGYSLFVPAKIKKDIGSSKIAVAAAQPGNQLEVPAADFPDIYDALSYGTSVTIGGFYYIAFGGFIFVMSIFQFRLLQFLVSTFGRRVLQGSFPGVGHSLSTEKFVDTVKDFKNQQNTAVNNQGPVNQKEGRADLDVNRQMDDLVSEIEKKADVPRPPSPDISFQGAGETFFRPPSEFTLVNENISERPVTEEIIQETVSRIEQFPVIVTSAPELFQPEKVVITTLGTEETSTSTSQMTGNVNPEAVRREPEFPGIGSIIASLAQGAQKAIFGTPTSMEDVRKKWLEVEEKYKAEFKKRAREIFDEKSAEELAATFAREKVAKQKEVAERPVETSVIEIDERGQAEIRRADRTGSYLRQAIDEFNAIVKFRQTYQSAPTYRQASVPSGRRIGRPTMATNMSGTINRIVTDRLRLLAKIILGLHAKFHSLMVSLTVQRNISSENKQIFIGGHELMQYRTLAAQARGSVVVSLESLAEPFSASEQLLFQISRFETGSQTNIEFAASVREALPLLHNTGFGGKTFNVLKIYFSF